jgi:hypothetical protein
VATPESVQDREALREEDHEAREGSLVVLSVIGGQGLLALVGQMQGWQIGPFPPWSWLLMIVPEVLLFATLAFGKPHAQIEVLGARRDLGLAAILIIVIGDLILVAALVISLAVIDEAGPELLVKGLGVWSSNVASFGLAFWFLDRGGPVRRLEPDAPLPEFLFPQSTSPELAEPGWRPHLVDYMYVAFTNAIAFSPTDTLPLSHRMKFLMLLEASMSAATLLLVVARAVNVFR